MKSQEKINLRKNINPKKILNLIVAKFELKNILRKKHKFNETPKP
jgi:hypothetical protein